MKRFTKLLSVLMVAVTTTALISCGGSSNAEADKSKAEGNSTNKKDITGTVDYAIPTPWVEGKQPLIDSFKEAYPNVTVNVINYDPDPDSFLTTQAATGDLPDVVEGWAGLTYPLSQGWVEPLDSYMEKDSDIKNLPQNLLEMCKVDGKTYAIPYRIPLQGVLVNLDLLDQLNLDRPEYDWSIDDFVESAKKATTDKYSGITNLGGLEAYFVTKLDDTLVEWGYDLETKKFNLTNGALEKSVNIVKDLRNVPGLVADSLKNEKLKEEGKEDDYQKKFGKEVDGFEDGKILFKPTGSWAFDNLKLNFNYDYLPYPKDDSLEYTQNMGCDIIYMTSTAEDKEAAYEFLKWLTYSEEGTLSFIEAREKQENPIPRVYIPVIKTDAVAEKIKNSSYVDGVKFMYDNLDKGKTQGKNIPGFNAIADEILKPQINRALKGELDISSVVKEMEEKANAKLGEATENLKKDMSEYYK